MKKTIYLHVGPHKTGTTVIQKACLDNRAVLNRNGVSYPPLFFNHLGHHGLVDAIRQRKIVDTDIEALDNCEENILFSSENFIHFNEADVKYLREKFSRFTIKIIYAWRRSSLKMYSLWQESVKHGNSTSFYAHFYRDLVKPGQSKTLLQIKDIDMFADCFGKENIHILDYEAMLKKGTLLHYFFDIMGIDDKDINISNHHNGIKNISLDPLSTEILRCLNSKSKVLGLAKNSKTREAYFDRQEKVNNEITEIQSMMQAYIEQVKVGGYMVDHTSEKAITHKYQDNIVSYQYENKLEDIRLISTDWLLNPKSAQLIDDIYKKIMGDL